MLKSILSFTALLYSLTAITPASLIAAPKPVVYKPELLSKTSFTTDKFKIALELWYDKKEKHPDLWVEYSQESYDDEARFSYKSTSMPEKFHEATTKLIAQPITRLDGITVLIYDGFDLRLNSFDGDRGMALLFHYPVWQLSKQDADFLIRNFPKCVTKDASNEPEFIKVIVGRITRTGVTPVAALDTDIGAELALPKN